MRVTLHAAIVAAALAVGASLAPAMAAKTSLTLGMVLEPPNLDPTAGAAAAIDEVVYANIFEGLTRIGPDGSVMPAFRRRGPASKRHGTSRTVRPDSKPCNP